jgi:hypothetical protein
MAENVHADSARAGAENMRIRRRSAMRAPSDAASGSATYVSMAENVHADSARADAEDMTVWRGTAMRSVF